MAGFREDGWRIARSSSPSPDEGVPGRPSAAAAISSASCVGELTLSDIASLRTNSQSPTWGTLYE